MYTVIVRSLCINNWRNIHSLQLEPHPSLTVISGQNGQGKTNLLESIWMLSGAKSFRGAKECELISKGCMTANITGQLEHEANHDFYDTVEILLRTDESTGRTARTAKKNGVDYGRAGNLAGENPCVVFAPGHVAMVKGSPESRRRFLDAALCQLYPHYLDLMRRYARTLLQKNSYLKDNKGNRPADALLDTFDAQLAEYGARLSEKRRAYLQLFAPAAALHYNGISGGLEQLCTEYLPNVPEEWKTEALSKALLQSRATDLRAGFCTVGPHRDDLGFCLNGEEARIYASQGQQRSIVLSCKIAELELIGRVTGQLPILLLDDVLSELDAARQDYLLNKIEGKQVFITSCGTELFSKTDGLIVTMENGRLK